MDYQLLASSPLFHGTTPKEIETMLSCLKAKERNFSKNTFLYRAGEQVHELGLVLSGSVSIESDDLWGGHTILDRVGPGRVFAETYACIPGEALMVNVVAMEVASVLFLDIRSMLQTCTSACSCHQKIIYNLLTIATQKNLTLSRRSLHTVPKTIRARLLSYLSFQALQQGRRDFYIPFYRQQLADYLNVDRSTLSAELGKMKKDGLLQVEKNHFLLYNVL